MSLSPAQYSTTAAHYPAKVGKGGGEPVSDEMEGTLYKWTNYIKGYQKRWLVLKDGRLAYYRWSPSCVQPEVWKTAGWAGMEGSRGSGLRRRLTLARKSIRKKLWRRSSFSTLEAAATAPALLPLPRSTSHLRRRNQGEVGQSCRGSINLSGATVLRSEESSSAFAVTHATQTFHLKAKDDADRHRWIAAIELGKLRAQKQADSDEEEMVKEGRAGAQDVERPDPLAAIAQLQSRVADLHTCQGLIEKHGNALIRCLGEVEKSEAATAKGAQEKVQERVTLFRITANAMMNAGKEFVSNAESQAKKWDKAFAHERQQRLQLQDQLEALAKTHNALEKATIKLSQGQGLPPMSGGPCSDSEEDIFQDAHEEIDELYNLTPSDITKTVLKRSGSQVSTEGMEDSEDKKERKKYSVLLDATIVSQSSGGARAASTPQRTKGGRPRRSVIPPRPNISLNLWSVMKNSIGKELSKIPMPVNFNEPLSMVQRLTEDMEYSYLLDDAAKAADSCEQMAYVAVFTASAYGTLTNRTGKPFNPLLGETYECDRMEDYGWRTLCEQVSHHPPAAAQHVQGAAGWQLWQEFTMSSKFRGKYLSVIPLGISHLEFADTKHHYTWRKVTTTVHNIIVGKLWIDNHGEMTIENHTTGDKCHLKYIPYSYFSRDTPRKVTGVVTDKSGRVRWVVQGTWDSELEIAKVLNEDATAAKPVFNTETPKLVWKKTPPLANCEEMYNFTKLAIELNEPEDGVAPTDSRLRPDQRLMETGAWDESNSEKLRLEEKQRAVRRKREAEAEQSMLQGKPYQEYEPAWFRKERDPYTGNLIHNFTGEYWDAKAKKDWGRCPDIY